MSSVGGVALRPCGQVARLLLLVLRVAATTVMRNPAGVALLRVAHPSSAGVHHAPITDCDTTVVASSATVHAEMIEARSRPRACPRGVHGWRGGGRWWMDVMKVTRRDGRSETDRNLPLQSTSLRRSFHLVTSDDDLLLRVFSGAFKANVSLGTRAYVSGEHMSHKHQLHRLYSLFYPCGST